VIPLDTATGMVADRVKQHVPSQPGRSVMEPATLLAALGVLAALGRGHAGRAPMPRRA
jgi:hypothetical protein